MEGGIWDTLAPVETESHSLVCLQVLPAATLANPGNSEHQEPSMWEEAELRAELKKFPRGREGKPARLETK